MSAKDVDIKSMYTIVVAIVDVQSVRASKECNGRIS